MHYFDENEVDDIVEHAKSLNVKILQTISTKYIEFESKILPFAEKYNNVYASVGIHPLETDKEKEISKDDLLKWKNHPKVIGIGETGLDYYREGFPDRELQIRNLKTHIDVSKETNLPIIIHNRSSDEDMIQILEEKYHNHSNVKGLIHCFSSSRELAETAVKLGFYISLSGIFTFENCKELRQIVLDTVPKHRLLVETDAPFLVPEPKRNEKRNKPGYTYYVLKKLAETFNMSEEEMSELTTNNFLTLFDKVDFKI